MCDSDPLFEKCTLCTVLIEFDIGQNMLKCESKI